MSVKFSNNGHSTLASSISTSDTSITVASGHGARFPSLSSGEYFYATLIDSSNNLEIVKCTARSSDVLTVTRAQESTTARAYAIGDRIELRVTAQGLVDATNVYDKDTTSTGYFDLPAGTTAQEPGNGTGRLRFDTDLGVVMFNDGTDWIKIAAQIAQLSSVSGNILAGATSTLTLTGSGFLTSNLIVNFTQVSDSIDVNVTVTPSSDTSASVTVPSTVYSNVTAGNSVSIRVTNSDGTSSAAVGITATALPSGGTVSNSGSYRIHTFTSSGTFTNTLSTTAEYLIVAGGGGGGEGGGGAGGMITGSATLSAGTNYSVVVGGGGAENGFNGNAIQGGNSTFSLVGTTVVGGGGGATTSDGADSGGSGGGGRRDGTTSGASGTSGQGNSGGTSSAGSYRGGGGGGGKGSAGSGGGGGSQTSEFGGAGGTGAASSISGSSVYYAGGGGGGTEAGARSGMASGGNGGGGRGNNGNVSGQQAQAGTANTGGGGGGCGGGGGGASAIDTPKNGGSGIVIIRYTI